MINRDSRGHSYLTVRGEILGFVKDGLLRKHLPRMFSLIKNEIMASSLKQSGVGHGMMSRIRGRIRDDVSDKGSDPG